MSQVQESKLAASQLSRLPKMNKSLFISSYIKDQKSHIKAYADQGHSFASSHSSQVPPLQKELGGFDTPVLKSRVPRPPKSPIEQKPRKGASITNTVDKHTEKPSKPQPKPKSSKKQVSSSSSRKRKAAEVSDTEQQARLKERRERRQVKQAIVQNKGDVTCSGVSDKDPAECKTGRQKQDKNKVPPGLALMHGFSATNIGKYRLTTQLPPMLGVFGRGKASGKAKISAKRADFGAIRFSEELFLNRSANSKTARHPSSSPSNNDTDDSRSVKSGSREKHSTRRQKDQRRVILHRKKDTATGIEELSAPEEDSDAEVPSMDPSPKEKALDSEIWDIEKSDFVLPSNSPSPIGSPANVSVVLDARRLHWSSKAKDNQLCVSSPVLSASRSPLARVDNIFPSPSLGPSQSASQQGQHLHSVDPAAVCVPSKYFPAPIVHNVETAGNQMTDAYALGSDLQSDVIECTIEDDSPPQYVDPRQYRVYSVPERSAPSEILDEYQEQHNLPMDTYDCDEHFLEGDLWSDSKEYPAHYRSYHASNIPDFSEYKDAADLDYQQFPHNDTALEIEDQSFEMNDTIMEPFVTQHYTDRNYYNMDPTHHYADDGDYWDGDHDEELIVVFDGDDQGYDQPTPLYESYDISTDGYSDEFAFESLSIDDIYDEGGQLDESVAFQARPSLEFISSAETSMDSVDVDSLGGAHNFLEGRELLCGFSEAFPRDFQVARVERGPTSSAEAQVAKTLRDHWLPQRL
ncbi:hypothetical protein IW261DRAFT_52415 [Armillaria novae-zelandiae]|uniref:Uncharacterized protein n=1 Tax=Armillaria novae-zelandiae TaxID=153914 RepID=A0AA39PVK4_9AGAR|nr:hypothetical protein IW261DRAFT_52415 [Armillaria novae-zelandiae]